MERVLNDRFNITRKDGKIFMNDNRFVFFPSSSFGLLRKELIENIGPDRVKGFLIRYGWDLGARDAKQIMELEFESLEEIMRFGPVLHAKKGHVIAKASSLHVEYKEDHSIQSVHMEGTWHDSYEAEEYIRYFGTASSPVCHTLIGYASGYLSGICKQKIIFKEIKCAAMGHEHCQWVGKTAEDWGEEIESELRYFVEPKIAEELEQTYEKLLEERNNLSKTWTVHKRLTEEILLGNGFHAIADVAYSTTAVPIMIIDLNCHPFAYMGIEEEEFHRAAQELHQYLQSKSVSPFQSFSAVKVLTDHFFLLITPIFLHKKRFGYCAFLYPQHSKPAMIDPMILERVSTVCSLYLLNEKTGFETEQRMKGHFLEEILRRRFTLKQEIVKRGRYVNMDLGKEFYIVIVQYTGKNEEAEHGLFYHDDILAEVHHYCKENRHEALIGQQTSGVVMLLQPEAVDKVEKSLKQLHRQLGKKFAEFHFKIGISVKGDNIVAAPEHYEEATIALRMASLSQPVITFDSLGVVGLLINDGNEQALRKFAQKTLGSLYHSKCSKDTELIKTLYTYLANGGNLEHTAQELLLSISGLRYRLQKIEATIGQELRNPMTNFQLFLIIQGLIVLGDICI
ncbi:MAG: XylR N-terminal domain-containing protein [Ectobacillus sp.]